MKTLEKPGRNIGDLTWAIQMKINDLSKAIDALYLLEHHIHDIDVIHTIRKTRATLVDKRRKVSK